MTAMRAARLLAAAAATGEAIDRRGGGRFVETYPAAALSIWGFPSRGYKGTKGEKVRAQLVRDFAEKTSSWLTLTKEDRSLHAFETLDEVGEVIRGVIERYNNASLFSGTGI